MQAETETSGLSKPAVGSSTYQEMHSTTVHISYVASTTKEENVDLVLAFRCSRLQGRQVCQERQ